MLVHEQFENEQLWNWGEIDTKELDKKKIGGVIRALNCTFKNKFMNCGAAAELDEVTLMHGWIMGYLYHNRDRDIYQKTIETEFNIKRSTVTAIVQLMEKKGYIRREAVIGDARLKRIILTRQGVETAVKTKSMIDKMDEEILSGIDKDKLDIFYEVSEKLIENMTRR